MLILSAAFVPSSFKGKELQQSDITQYKGAASEIMDYEKNKNDDILWTNSQFGGMPTYMIKGLGHLVPIKWLRFPKTPQVWSKIFLYLICAYIMFISFGVRPWIAVIGAVGLGFATENFTIINVGHNTKALAIAYLPLVIAGCQFLFRKKYLLGLAVLSVGMGLEVLVNHLQITYYGGFLIAIFFIFQLVKHIKEGQLKDYFVAAGLALLGLVFALGANALPLMLTNEYSESSIRGKTELLLKKENGKIVSNTDNSSGLTESYAFSYSNGWTDIFATIIPNYSGGDSDKLGLYYGDIGSTSGPKYVGATMFFLMVIGFIFLNGPIRYWLLSVLLLAIILSMGQNHFTGINDFFFNNVPFYNKFRAPSMIMALVQICVALMAIVGLERIISLPQNDEKVANKLKYAGFGALGFVVILTFFSTVFNDFNSNPQYNEVGEMVYDNDTRFAQSNLQQGGQQASPANINQFKEMLADKRIEAMKKDGYRSLFFIGALFLIIWFYYKKKFELKYALIAIGLLVTADMWGVGKRYLSDDDFKRKISVQNAVVPNSVDLEIMKDPSYHRVLDLTVNPLASTRASFFHKSLGGYSAAKIRRYQEVWDWYLMDDLSKGKISGNQILNMLNTKYVMFPDRQNNSPEPKYTVNTGALGNAWFVPSIQLAANPDSAMVALGRLNATEFAIVEKKFEGNVSATSSLDSNSSITLLNYHPENLSYESNSASGGFAVFSEIYYNDGWNAYIDDKQVDHVCANYILRGLQIPAGKHKVEFKFEPQTYATGKMLSNTFSGLIYLLLIGTIALGVKKEMATKTTE